MVLKLVQLMVEYWVEKLELKSVGKLAVMMVDKKEEM
jgi:hypothetical protein